MKTRHIDSYKVPTVDSYHIMHVGASMFLPPKTGGFLL